MKKYALFASFLLLTGCILKPQHLKDNVSLKKTEGIVSFIVKCDDPVGSFSMYPLNVKPTSIGDTFGAPIKVQFCNPENEFRSFKVKEGTYYLAIVWGPNTNYILTPEKSIKFHVASETITDIGELHIVTRTSTLTNVIYFDVQVNDSQKGSANYFKEKYPQLYTKYPYKTLKAAK